MKRYIRASTTNMSDISPIDKDSSEYRRLQAEIDREYRSICPTYADWFDFYYQGGWKNTDKGIQFITTTWLTTDNPHYDESRLSPVPLKYVYRAVSIPEYEYILKTGQIKSNSSMNIGYEAKRGLTCYHKSFPGWYLPDDGGYILKVRATPDMFIDNVDQYIKTPTAVSVNNVVEVNGIPV